MNSRFDDIANVREQVRLRANIAEVIGRHVNLKAHGATMKGLCPFHNEKTPSFTVNPAKGVFYCFGCGKGGDVFRFVQEIEGVDFLEALKMLAEDTGVRFETRQYGTYDKYDRYDDSDDRYGEYDGRGETPASRHSTSPSRPAKSAKTDLLAIHDEAANFYYRCVKQYPQAVDYFKSRGLTGKTVQEFRLGYAPPGWSALFDYLQGKKFTQSQIIESGLVVAKDGGTIYDRFRDRIIFSLADLNGRVIAFAGRGLNADVQPKYLNSPETPLYQKSRVLYGLHKSRQGIRDSGYLLIVEGYTDYLTLYQEGIVNATAVSGTAFTADHAHLIKRFASKIILVFDGDRAGLAAAQRAAFVLAPFNLQASILTLPTGDDPDTFVKREGADAFKALLSSSAKPVADFLIDKLISEHDDTSHSKSKIADELVLYARTLSDSIVRDDFLTKLTQRLRVDRHHITEKFNKAGNSRLSSNDASAHEHVLPGDEKALGKLEEDFLRIILTRPEFIIHARRYISPETFTDATPANIYSVILECYASKGNLDELPDAIGSDSEAVRLVSMLTVKPMRMENIQAELDQKILRLRRKHLKNRMSLLREALGRGSEADKGQLLEEIKKCGEFLKELEQVEL
ncbi:MAG: DNA primase [Chitinispirillales bacterium]|jgi:DNA primase|nr:DNA primase [Chitinispirillales bacterium]